MPSHTKRKLLVVVGSVGLLLLGTEGCRKQAASTPAPILDASNGPDPADANLAQVDPNAPNAPGYAYPPNTSQASARVLGARSAASSSSYGEQYPEQADYDGDVDAGEQALYADQAPPPLPVYQQPELTEAGDEWTPGYWNYSTGGYYWVPGAWVAAPYRGALWTPGYWGRSGNRYRFHRGFWGLHIGFYGGVPYGFGYTGEGYHGGYWNQNTFFYNSRVNRISVTDVRNVYERNVTVVNPGNRLSYNGPGGIDARPRPAELAAFREQHAPPMRAQIESQRVASENRAQFFAQNHGQPAVAVRQEHFAADRGMSAPVAGQNVRGGFGQRNPAQQTQRNTQPPQMNAQRTQPLQQRNQVQQQRSVQQQRTEPAQQRNEPGRIQQAQQHAAQANQQQAQQRQQVEQQRAENQQNHLQQRQQVQQRQAQQQQTQVPQQRPQELQQRTQPQQQPRVEQQQTHRQEQPQRAAPPQQQRPAAQPRQEAPRPEPQARPQGGGGHEEHGGGRPRR